MTFGLRKLFAQLVSKIFNLCRPDPPTAQTDGQTDGQTTCDRKTALCTTVHRAVKTALDHGNAYSCCTTATPTANHALLHSPDTHIQSWRGHQSILTTRHRIHSYSTHSSDP